MPPRLGYGTGMGNSDMLRGGNGIGVPRPKPAPLPTLDRKNKIIALSQDNYIDSILSKYNM